MYMRANAPAAVNVNLPLLGTPGQNEPLHGTQSADVPEKKKRTYRPLQQFHRDAKEDGLPPEQDDTSCDGFYTHGIKAAQADAKLLCEAPQARIITRENQQRQK
jgi:hypothetical protein